MASTSSAPCGRYSFWKTAAVKSTMVCGLLSCLPNGSSGEGGGGGLGRLHEDDGDVVVAATGLA